MMQSGKKSSEGIFVLNGQVFSAHDLINVMRRQGIQIKVAQGGLLIEGERISSISQIGDSSCPLAKDCEKRKAIVEFIKLQNKRKNRPVLVQEDQDHFDDSFDFDSSISVSRGPFREHIHEVPKRRKEEPLSKSSGLRSIDDLPQIKEDTRRDFLKPNNHDLFEGNISKATEILDPMTSIEEEEDVEISGLFDEPSLFEDASSDDFEDSLFQDSSSSSQEDFPVEDHYSESNLNRNEKPFCSECGFDLSPNWNSCPNCGYKIPRVKTRSDKVFY